jgi:hypothetical protein
MLLEAEALLEAILIPTTASAAIPPATRKIGAAEEEEEDWSPPELERAVAFAAREEDVADFVGGACIVANFPFVFF